MNGKAENFAEVPGRTLLLSNNTKGFLPCSGVVTHYSVGIGTDGAAVCARAPHKASPAG